MFCFLNVKTEFNLYKILNQINFKILFLIEQSQVDFQISFNTEYELEKIPYVWRFT